MSYPLAKTWITMPFQFFQAFTWDVKAKHAAHRNISTLPELSKCLRLLKTFPKCFHSLLHSLHASLRNWSISKNTYPLLLFVPGGGLSILTDRDQRSWAFLNDPKNILPPTEDPRKILCLQQKTPKKYFPKGKTLKIPSFNTIYLVNVKHNMIIKNNCANWSIWWRKRGNKNMFKI